MNHRNFRPAAQAVARLILRACGWEPIYSTVQDLFTIARTFQSDSKFAPSSNDIQNIVDWAENSIRLLFEAEQDNVKYNDINAAVLAVADLLNAQSHNEVVLQAVTDSSALEVQLLLNRGAEIRQGLLSTDSISAFDILLRSSCRHLAEVTLSAPEFGPLALQQLLRTQGRLERITSQIYESLATLLDSHSTEEDFDRFTSRYMTRVFEQLDFLDIPGIDLDRYRQRYNLTMAYIPLSSTSQAAQQFEFGSIESLFRARAFILVVGEPGSGKSTLLKWAAVETARSQLNLSSHQRIVPFLVKIRSLADPLPDLDDIGAPMTHGLVVTKPPHWSADLIRTGRAILLFDGLDEVPEDRREGIVKWISQIYDDNRRRGLRIIVTSRLTAIRESRFRLRNADMVTLQPMPQGKIERFVRVWHRAVYEGTDAPPLTEWLATSEQLLARLEDDTQLTRLAANPLLCAVICALYHARNRHLPSERSELYTALLAMLLARRDLERKGIEGPLSLTDTQRLVEDLALVFLLQKKDQLSRAQVLDILSKSLATFRNHTIRDMRAALVLDHFVNRTSVLRELPSANSIDFWHKSFQEFLAARMLVAQGRDEELLNRCSDATWREVVIWACSSMTTERASSLIIGVLDAADSTSAESDRNYLRSVALSCAHYAVQLTSEAQQRLSGSAAELIPPRNSAKLALIIDLGPVAVPLLEDVLRSPSRYTAMRRFSNE